MLKKITSILIIAVIISSISVTTFAATKSELQKQKEEAQEDKKEVQEQKSAVMDEIDKLNISIQDNEDKLADINTQLTQLNKEIKETQDELEETQKKFNAQEEALKEKMILSYELGTTTYLDVLLNSKGVLDFLSNYYLISEILQNDDDLLNSLEEQKKKIEESKQKLQDKQKEVKTQKAEQEKINVVLSNQKNQKQNKVSQLSAEEKELSEEIDEINKAIRQIEEEARKASQNSTGYFVGGEMMWPCPASTRISSNFGPRSSPGGVGSTNHKGIDIPASAGSAIVAALDGKVIQCGYNRARGYYVMIDHGGGIITLYQHGLSGSTRVSVGQSVKQGQTILGVGSTGYSTGNHLHFEVWKNGTPVNPLSYVK